MRGLRVIFLLILMLPSAAVAIPCCDEQPATDCCGPVGACPATPSGECVFMTDAPPIASAEALALDAPASHGVVAEQRAVLARSQTPALVTEGHGPSPPLYLTLGMLRN